MSEEKFSALLRVAIVPQVVEIIMRECEKDEVEATEAFYNSQTYKYLSNEETKVWHFSPMTLFNMWKEECETGKVVFPEEGV